MVNKRTYQPKKICFIGTLWAFMNKETYTIEYMNEENFQQLKHLYGESSSLSQTSFGHLFNLVKTDMQTRARESVENSGMLPKLSEKN